MRTYRTRAGTLLTSTWPTQAFQTGDTSAVREALAMRADPSFRRHHSDGTTPLMAAAWCGDTRLVAELLDRGEPDQIHLPIRTN